MKVPEKILLHVCCGPCSTHVIEKLIRFATVKAYFYNPNIHPEAEYRLRLSQVYRCLESKKIELIEGEYQSENWLRSIRGLEKEPEGGKRCDICYAVRLEKVASLAKDIGYDCFATTLTIGPSKKASIINEIGERIARSYGVSFLKEDFKKEDGFKRSCELSRELNLYRQNYCGCIFSMR